MTNDGTVTLKAGVNANFWGVAGSNVAYVQNSGTTALYGGSGLSMDAGIKDMQMTGGVLYTVIQDYTQSYDRTASISAHDLGILGGDIYINSYRDVPHAEFGTLLVSGSVTWSGGTYHPFIEGTENGGGTIDHSDLWSAQSFTIGGTASLDVTSIAVLDGYVWEAEPTSGYKWNIFYGSNGITGNPVNDPGPYGLVWDQLGNSVWLGLLA